MKHFLNNSIPIVILIIILFGFSDCEVADDVTSECNKDENKMGTVSRTFALGANVKFKNGLPAPELQVVFYYKHEYCSGEINGENEISPYSPSDENGYVYSSYLQTYDYTNKKDKVHVKIVAFYSGCALGKFEKVFNWEDVDEELDEHVLGEVVRTFDVDLDYNFQELMDGNFECIEY